MTGKKPSKKQTEEFVRRVLVKTFNQRVNKETLREVAEKVLDAIATTPPKGSRSKEAA